MKNKFKIRNLENEKRRLDKIITKLKAEDDVVVETLEVIGYVTEERTSVVDGFGVKRTVDTTFNYEFYRMGREITCKFTDANKKVIGIGTSKCVEDDNFVLSIGCELAERRAIADYYRQVSEIVTKDYR